MTQVTCEQVRDLLPEWIHGTLSQPECRGLEEHLEGCQECSGEARLLKALMAGRPEAPAGLEAAIALRLQAELGHRVADAPETTDGRAGKVIPLFGRRWPRMPAWALSAAALVILSLGTGIVWNRWRGNGAEEIGVVAVQESAPESWLWDDGLVAGAPVFDGLSDEDLETLLKELEG